MKIKYTVIIFLQFVLLSCNSSKYFEGIITYHFESDLYTEGEKANNITKIVVQDFRDVIEEKYITKYLTDISKCPTIATI